MGRPDRKTGFREWQVRTAARCAFLNLSRIMAALPFGPLPKAEKAMFINSLRNKLWKWLCCTCLPWTKKSWGIHHFCTLSWKVKVAQLCPTLCNYTVHGILQARILEWVAFPFSSESSWSRNQIRVSWIAGRFFTSWAARESLQLYGSLNILWHCASLGLEWKLTFSSPVVIVEFSKFVDTLSAAL